MGPRGSPGSADIRISEVEGSVLFETPQYRGETLATKTITDLLALKSDTGHHHDIAELNAIPTCASNPTAVACRNGNVMYLAGIPFSPASTINGRVVSHEVVTGMRLTTNSGAGFSQIGTFDLLGRQLVSYVATVIAPDGSSIVANASSQFLLRMVGGRVLASHNNLNLNGQEVVLTLELAPLTLKGIAIKDGGNGGKNGI